MYCLDTYALIEIALGNPKFSFLLTQDVVIPATTLAEFFWVLLRDKNKEEAEHWSAKLLPLTKPISPQLLLNAQQFRYDEKKHDLSFFDAVGYTFAQEQKSVFVTGDKEFKGRKGVRFIQK